MSWKLNQMARQSHLCISFGIWIVNDFEERKFESTYNTIINFELFTYILIIVYFSLNLNKKIYRIHWFIKRSIQENVYFCVQICATFHVSYNILFPKVYFFTMSLTLRNNGKKSFESFILRFFSILSENCLRMYVAFHKSLFFLFT